MVRRSEDQPKGPTRLLTSLEDLAARYGGMERLLEEFRQIMEGSEEGMRTVTGEELRQMNREFRQFLAGEGFSATQIEYIAGDSEPGDGDTREAAATSADASGEEARTNDQQAGAARKQIGEEADGADDSAKGKQKDEGGSKNV